MPNPSRDRTDEFDVLHRARLAAGQDGWDVGAYEHPEIRPFIERMIAGARLSPAQTAVLDLGCGTGGLSCWLATLGFAVTGVDIAPAAIARAREEAARRQVAVNFQVCDLSQQELPAGSFDVVIDARVLHCLVDRTARAALLAHIRMALNPGGEFWSESMAGRPQVARGPGWRLDDEGLFWKAVDAVTSDEAAVWYEGAWWLPTRRIPPTVEALLAEFRAAGFRVIGYDVAPPTGETDVAMAQTRCTLPR